MGKAKFAVGTKVVIKFPLHKLLAPSWHRKHRREGRRGVITKVMLPTHLKRITVPSYKVKFSDGKQLVYPEDYLRRA